MGEDTVLGFLGVQKAASRFLELVPPSREIPIAIPRDSYPSTEKFRPSTPAAVCDNSLTERVSGSIKKVVKKTFSGLRRSLGRGTKTLSQTMGRRKKSESTL